MPNTREKLMRLLCTANSKATEAEAFEDATYAQQLGIQADHLIANGVTVQEWISVKDRLPDNSVKYIVVADSKYHSDMRVVSAKSLMVEEFWGMPMGYFAHGQQVTHWMPLPQPPKGE